MGLSSEMLRGLETLGFHEPSEIQAQAIPLLLDGDNDLIGLAQTGTGKTGAFGIPLLERIDHQNPRTQALILAPTRELGQQIAQQLSLFSKYQERVNVLAVYGGAAISNQIKDLKRPQQVIIATPGRLIDLIERKAIDLSSLSILVLDEADEMLNMGFKEELDKILSYTPASKLTWLFSATMPQEIRRMVQSYMNAPVEVRVSAKDEVNKNIDHQYVITQGAKRREALTRFLDHEPDTRGVVFCRTKRDTQDMAEWLMKHDYRSDALHGDLSQQQRDRVMKRFKDGELQVLIATDVAARGIDVNDLTHVFHMALSDDPAYYTHRSGRTARAGKKGISLVLGTGRDKGRLLRLEEKLGINFSKAEVPTSAEIQEARIDQWCNDILNTKPKDKIDGQLFFKVASTLSGMTKEELIAKLLVLEMERNALRDGDDLNQRFEKGSSKSHQSGRRPYNKNKGSNKGGKKNFHSKSRHQGRRRR
ncbi:MAG: DEAD/DEAH box helicase [Flavobacteriales bacterium]|nr:DEAD/DEAH box helicase [Flavobacteriales bacterium]